VGTLVEVATTATWIRARRVVAYSDVRAGEFGMLVDAWDWSRSSATRERGCGDGRDPR
jgi:hypothetical protein